MEYTPIKIVKLASDYLDEGWKYEFPWINDVAELWDTTNSKLQMTIKIRKYSASDNDLDMISMEYSEISNEDEVHHIDLYPSQIVTGQYMIGSTCYCLKLVHKHIPD